MTKITNNYNTDNDVVSMEDVISLKQFPPMLRKLGKFLLNNDHPMTISAACDEINLNKESVYSSICRSRKNGHDFVKFIDQQAKSLLHANKLAVYDRLTERAVSDSSTSHNDRKTFLQLTGDLKESAQVGNLTLTVGVNISTVQPQDTRDKGVIDVEPVIPKGK